MNTNAAYHGRYTDEYLTNKLVQVYDKYKGYITIAKWRSEIGYPSPYTLINRFGSWITAWEQIGVQAPASAVRQTGLHKTVSTE